jgi:hypothetical protein
MGLDIYWIGLLVLVPLVAVVAGHKTILSLFQKRSSTETEKQESTPLDDEARKFQKTFLRVYLLVVGSEWLQVSQPHHGSELDRYCLGSK